ncbi:MAG: hypothetical protein KF823_09305 [Xanthomonadales bacterium]|nr:hypothetical protein [Xanthomonadales bacterium]
MADSKVKNDLRRSALVTAVTGVDAYMHWLVYQRLSDVRNQGDLPKALGKLEIPFSDLAQLADATLSARKRKVKSRPWVQVKHSIQSRLLKETFQSFDQVAKAFSLAGVKEPWSRIAAHLGEKSPAIKSRLDNLVHRRNQIVHEGDIARASRPQKLKYNDMDHAQTENDVAWIENLIKSAEAVVQAGSPP